MKNLLSLLFLLSLVSLGYAQKITERNFKPFFDRYGVNGCFVLFDEANNELIRYNPAICDSGFIPASTFKIPHSVIALEEGVVSDTEQVIPWNGHEWPVKKWNHDQTLRTAIKYSCVWVYTGFAEKIGIDKYRKYVRAFDYGNKNLNGPPTRFWLAGEFRISANQQIAFLRKFYYDDLPVSKESIDKVRKLIVLEKGDDWTLSGKTGGGVLNDNDYIMWLVGYVEKDNHPYFYAMNFVSDDFNGTSQARYKITKDILMELKIIEP
ncbi:penicillin-binding transpeptidase domain-containing protein [Prolixibacter denitrificans]|uniref:beta-lactamase n=1 Tax=Prolixibacter denitrificans TaxID=1541063 RepID=A0A2P8CFD3_9BACT|nr:penicillin-binding transpeptidase domain-containing protein [Prolixibacter denitrificans]PSK83690.1 beta-lactamase class D/beta-lactamase class D OXA-48 [Prolixibacter denitrificans]GET23235.1 beta-lactamase [Prolixibacter denitrificans]